MAVNVPTTVLPVKGFIEEFFSSTAGFPLNDASVAAVPAFKFASEESANGKKHGHADLLNALNEANACGGYRFLTTNDSLSKDGEVHHGLYPSNSLPDVASKHSDWLLLELSVIHRAQYTRVDFDPFDDDHVHSPVMSDDRSRVLKEMRSQFRSILSMQRRSTFFFLLVLGDDARLVRFDIAGVATTKKFNYKACPEVLLDLLFRYSRATPAERGHDTSAHLIEPASEIGEIMQRRVESATPEDDVALGYFHESLDPIWPWWRLEVHDEDSGEIKQFAVGKPRYSSTDVFGHATRGYVALDLTTGYLTFLKESWRPTLGIDASVKEGSVLKRLNKLDVPFVPTVLCHGDIPGQISKSQRLAATSEVSQPGLRRGYVHYRVVMKEVGKPIEDFEHGAELISVIRDCVKAHKHAYESGIIHRDISPKNFLLQKREDGLWDGLLIDWDMSTTVDRDPDQLVMPERAGTWEFMSVNAQFWPSKVLAVEDELESFLYSLVYVAVQYIHSSVSPANIPYFIAAAFHDFQTCPITGRYRPCSMKWFTMSGGQFDVYAWTEPFRYARLEFLSGSQESGWKLHPIDHIMTSLMSWLKTHHRSKDESTPSKVSTHDALVELMEDTLLTRTWPLDDKCDFSEHWKRKRSRWVSV